MTCSSYPLQIYKQAIHKSDNTTLHMDTQCQLTGHARSYPGKWAQDGWTLQTWHSTSVHGSAQSLNRVRCNIRSQTQKINWTPNSSGMHNSYKTEQRWSMRIDTPCHWQLITSNHKTNSGIPVPSTHRCAMVAKSRMSPVTIPGTRSGNSYLFARIWQRNPMMNSRTDGSKIS